MKRICSLIALPILLVILAACNQANSNAKVLPTPPSGKATVIGQIVPADGGQPYSNVTVRLAEVYRQGGQAAFALDAANSPGAITDTNGNFVFSNVDAREYVLVVGDPMVSYTIVAQPDGNARVWNAESGKITDIGQIPVNYTP
jgi:hypothetical protein